MHEEGVRVLSTLGIVCIRFHELTKDDMIYVTLAEVCVGRSLASAEVAEISQAAAAASGLEILAEVWTCSA